MPKIRGRRTLGDRLERRRIELRLKPTEAAERLGVSDSTWFAWRSGATRPDGRNHGRIADFLGWAPGEVADVLDGKRAPLRPANVVPLRPGAAHAPPEDPDVEELRDMLREMGWAEPDVEEMIADYLSEKRDDDSKRHQRYMRIARRARG